MNELEDNQTYGMKLVRNLSSSSSTSRGLNKNKNPALAPANDYSSSSEVSCDTVVVNRGTCGGGMISRKHLNVFKMNPSNSTSSSISSSSSSSSPLSSSSSTTTLFAPNSSRTGRIKLGVSSNVGLYRSSSTSSHSHSNEIWIDGPKSTPMSTTNKPLKSPLTPPDALDMNEIWIDGPNAGQRQPNDTHRLATYLQSLRLLNDGKFSAFDYADHHHNRATAMTESLEQIDRELLNQLNKHDADIKDTVFKLESNSRPISLLSVNSNVDNASIATNTSLTTTTNDSDFIGKQHNLLNRDDLSHTSSSSSSSSSSNVTVENCVSYRQKLEDLKTSYDQTVFKQTYKPMESLHKTLESFLNLEQSSKFKMKQIKSTMLYPVNDLLVQPQPMQQPKSDLSRIDNYLNSVKLAESAKIGGIMSPLRASGPGAHQSDKEKRLSRILSPTRFRPAPNVTQLVMMNPPSTTTTTATTANSSSPVKPTSPSGCSSSSSSSTCSSSSSASLTPPNFTPNSSFYQDINYSIPFSSSTSSSSSVSYLNHKNLASSTTVTTSSSNQYSEPFDRNTDSTDKHTSLR